MKSSNGYRRTPNTTCIVCGKPLYRRPFEMKKTRFAACMLHRAEAQVLIGITNVQKAALSLGRKKGTNHLEGIPKSEESKRKRSEAMTRWCAENPELVKARGAKTRGANHYRWNGGSSRLNNSIRRMTEHRKWMGAVKERDRQCAQCGSTETLESHHVVELAVLISEHNVKNRKDARNTPELWDLDNGITLCQECHYKEHGREYDNHRGNTQEDARTPTEDVQKATEPSTRGGRGVVPGK